MSYFLETTVQPAEEPLTLAEVKLAINVDSTDKDAHVARVIRFARKMVEEQTGRTIIATTYRYTIQGFRGHSGPITLPRTPVTSVGSVIYTSSAGSSTTLAADQYTVSLGSGMRPARIIPAYLGSWPLTRGHIDDVAVTFTAGAANREEAHEKTPELIEPVWMLVDYVFANPTSRDDAGLSRAMESAWTLFMPTISRPVLA